MVLTIVFPPPAPPPPPRDEAKVLVITPLASGAKMYSGVSAATSICLTLRSPLTSNVLVGVVVFIPTWLKTIEGNSINAIKFFFITNV
ncbi:hypothetical protein [Chryseobacterium sp. ERMR1:04]|uniref:hypothetical protein n=1 Tax=Chryseobacterium sp. ERMR1:04 TaxID=1705393 RepID=UPI00136494F0|nr:hypothetical protein [Chryseobacterium sp. ERMR1:04]